MIRTALGAAILLLAGATPARAAAGDSLVDWLRDERRAFELARDSDRPVLLYLEAVWCHWCHVIDRETYGDPTVAALINAHFVPLRIDQDSRPDLANRYRDYGWPATIFFTPNGRDMVKRQGYIAPEPMARLLRAIVADPTPEAAAALAQPASYAAVSSLAPALRQTLEERHLRYFDAEVGGLAINQKFLDRDSVELDLVRAGDGDEAAEARARKTLDAAIALVDPVWGGVYQYSTYRDWDHPHFEKLATIQGEYLRSYALAYARLGDERYLAAARAIERYLTEFLTDADGAFFASQDADLVQGEKAADYFAQDDARRRQLGIPRIDRNRYARENGVIIEGLVALHEATGDPAPLSAALTAARWILAHRLLPGDGYRHGERDPAGPYLADTLAMGRAFLGLYRATADRAWIDRANEAADFVAANFRDPSAGFVTAVGGDSPIAPLPDIDENIALARFANLLHQVTARARPRDVAEHAMRYLATPAIATRRITEAGILLADRELNTDPLHLTVVAPKGDAAGAALFRELLRQPGWYRRVEWWDRAEGPLPDPAVTYPQLERAAAFVCTENRCSLPIFQPTGLASFLATP